jgi:intracellular septation protein A
MILRTSFMQSDLLPLTPSLSWRAALPSVQRALVRFALVGMTPIAAFYLAYRLVGPVEGMVAGTATATLALLIQAVRMRRLDPLGIVPIGAVLIQGAAGIVFQSVDVYLAAPALETSLWGVVLLGSVVVRRPLILLVANELDLIPMHVRQVPAVGRSCRQLTVAWGLMSFVKAAMRLFLLSALPLEVFLIANTVVITAMNVVLLGFTTWFVARAARMDVSTTPLAASSP